MKYVKKSKNVNDERKKIEEEKIRILCALGVTCAQIAQELNIAVGSVGGKKNSVENLYSKKMIQLLFKDYDDDIEVAKITRVPVEVINTLRNEYEEEATKIRSLVAQGLSSAEIAKSFNLSSGQLISARKAKLGKVYTKDEIINLLPTSTNSEIAAMARIPEEIVEQIRNMPKVTKKNLETLQQDGEIGKREEQLIRNYVAQGLSAGEIVIKLNYTKQSIKNIKYLLGMYSKVQIVNLLAQYTNSEINYISGVDEDVIEQIRKENIKSMGENKISKIQGLEYDLRDLIASGISIDEICSILEVDDSYVKAGRTLYGMYSNIQIRNLLKIKSIEEIAEITKVPEETIRDIKEKRELEEKLEYKKQRYMMSLLKMLKQIGTDVPTTYINPLIEKKISRILKKLSKVLTSVDYTFIAYAYLKIGMEERSIKIAQRHLNVEGNSKQELINKINEIMQTKLKEKSFNSKNKTASKVDDTEYLEI